MIRRISYVVFITAIMSACAQQPSTAPDNATISLPVIGGWYEGTKVYYLTTDISDKELAAAMGANYVPRLEDAIPNYPKPPAVKTVLERVYVFPGKEQPSILASAPQPIGPNSHDNQYSPLWLVYEVSWNQGADKKEITSEEPLLAAEEKGLLTITRTRKVVNCPIVVSENGNSLGVGLLPGNKTVNKQW
ncbi:MAG: hypothetical protein H7A01_08490 [Hahellaceae bacterium]|nr:hypothetical protein [Hahellaceae bacterium]MCP5211492.1 hypothetical protein [Hahellaceae bacterium]